MKLQLLTAVASVAILAAPSMASAQDSGWYLRGQAGYGTHTDMDFTGTDLVGDVESEGNATFSLGVGYDFGNNWRVEVDGGSLFTDLGEISQFPTSIAKLRTNTLMLNALYDFNDFGSWEPYVGAGIGLVRGKISAESNDTLVGNQVVSTPNCIGGVACGFRQSDSGLGWQLLAGLGYAITDNLTWDTQYRYLDATNFDVEGHKTTSITNFQASSQTAATSLEDVGAHSLMTGFRYRFGASAPTPMVTCWDGSKYETYAECPEQPPAPTYVTCWDGSQALDQASCPPQIRYQTCWDGSQVTDLSQCPVRETYTCRDGSTVYDLSQCVVDTTICDNEYRQEIIYYEFDRGQSAETRNTINRILDIGAYCQVGDIRVVGHTDTSGSAAYNLRLSERRAKDARDELVRQGINDAVITSEGKGETEPFVQTGDGVKEQLNRRTEVLIRLNSVGFIN